LEASGSDKDIVPLTRLFAGSADFVWLFDYVSG
jgi:hypothetical protein